MPGGALEILSGDLQLATVATLAGEPEDPYVALIKDVLDGAVAPGPSRAVGCHPSRSSPLTSTDRA